jgi:DNA-directed RNA polymerase specialized sigma24 family protein
MWIITTSKRESLRCLPSRRRTVPYDPLDPSWAATPAEHGEPVAELLRAERHEVLLAGLAELSARHRELLLLLMEDPPLSYAQISELTGIATGSIGPTRGRALERLRQTAAVSHHLAGPARVPVVPDGAAGLGRATARDSDRLRER